MKRVFKAATQTIWEIFKDRGILWHFHERPRACLFSPEHRMLSAGITLTEKHRTVALPNGEQRELQDECNENQPSSQGQNGEQYVGFGQREWELNSTRRCIETYLEQNSMNMNFNAASKNKRGKAPANKYMDFIPRDADSLEEEWTLVDQTSSWAEEIIVHCRRRFRTSSVF